MKFAGADTETGGLDPALHDLLTLHIKVLDFDLNVLDQLDLKIKHDVYRVTAGALGVNKIDLVKHHQAAIPKEQAKTMIMNFLAAHSHDEKLLWMMHNAPFDKGFLDSCFGKDAFKEFVDYHSLDTVTLGVVEKWLGTMSPKQSLSLAKIADALHLEKGPAHEAEGDVITMVNYARDFLTRIRAKLRGGS